MGEVNSRLTEAGLHQQRMNGRTHSLESVRKEGDFGGFEQFMQA